MGQVTFDLPVDVLRVEDLPVSRRRQVIRDMDRDNAEIRRHGEVSDGAREERDREQVVEDPLALLGEVGKADDDDEREGVDGAHGPEPVRAADGEVTVAHWGVYVQGVVGASEEIHLDWALLFRGRLKSCDDGRDVSA